MEFRKILCTVHTGQAAGVAKDRLHTRVGSHISDSVVWCLVDTHVGCMNKMVGVVHGYGVVG